MKKELNIYCGDDYLGQIWGDGNLYIPKIGDLFTKNNLVYKVKKIHQVIPFDGDKIRKYSSLDDPKLEQKFNVYVEKE